MYSYMAVLWDPADTDASQEAARFFCAEGLEPAPPGDCSYRAGIRFLDLSAGPGGPSLVHLHAQSEGYGGLVFGKLFARSSSAEPQLPLARMRRGSAEAILRSGGISLFTQYWGRYVALLKSREGHLIIADPAASVPAFVMQKGSLAFAFSHLEHCPGALRTGLTLNPDFISALIAYDKIQNGETGLKGVYEVRAGERLLVSRGVISRLSGWTPHMAALQVYEPDQTQAAKQLRDTTIHVVGSLAADQKDIVLSLSGGLDSAIVGACLRECGAEVRCLHFVTGGGDHPETEYARRVASHLSFPLHEVGIDPAAPLPAADSHPLSPRPFREFLGLHQTAVTQRDPHLSGKTTFTGQGGDHLFLETRSTALFADYLRAHGVSPRAGRILFETALLTGRSVWYVAREALRYRPNRVPAQAIPDGRQTRMSRKAFMGADWSHLLPDWAQSPAGLPPGKFEQVASLAHMYQIRRSLGSVDEPPTIHPLISQPLMEFCLALPTYLLCAGGRSRGLVRRAMTGLLPDEVRLRRSKGDASRFYTAQLYANRARIREALMEGELVRRDLICRSDVEQFFLSEDFHLQSSGRMVLVHYVIEAWLRAWKSHLAAA